MRLGPRPARLPAAATGLLGALALLIASVTVPVSASEGAEDPGPVSSGQLPQSGAVAVHDPSLTKHGDTYVVAGTHNSILTAPSLNGPWTNRGTVPKAPWTYAVSTGTLWAPQLIEVDGTYHYYYSQSSFGSQNSAIGLKTTVTPADPLSYVDRGIPIITTGNGLFSILMPRDDAYQHNAIDPHVSQDREGRWWIAWGSHFDGIMIQRLEDDMVTVTGEVQQLASRGSEHFPIQEGDSVPPNRVEGPAIFEHNGYYYLLTGWDWCCRGGDSTYKIVVGRSENIDGPYVDKNGVLLTEGGGTTILGSRSAQSGVTPPGLYRAPGGSDVFVENGTLYMVYHAYLPQNTLAIRPMDWHDDWPYFQEPGGGPYDLSDGSYYRLTNQGGHISEPAGLQNPVASDRCLTAVDEDGVLNVIQATCDESLVDQVWELQQERDGFYRFRSMLDDGQYCLAMSDDTGEIGTTVVVSACDATEVLQEWHLDDTGHGYHRPVVREANLALEVQNVCSPAGSYNCDGALGTNVIGGIRRDGENAGHAAGNARHANKWPPQQWRLSAASVSSE